jgi:hypothetical protein
VGLATRFLFAEAFFLAGALFFVVFFFAAAFFFAAIRILPLRVRALTAAVSPRP